MQHILLLFIVMMGTYTTRAQYVGVNKTNPTEALDVNGNINLSGAIKINGSSGNEGQVLASNGMGGMWWLPSSNPAFTRIQVFNSINTFTIPSDAKFIRFEVWSGGGRAYYDPNANKYYSGGGGAYATGIISVTPGTQLQIRVPAGQNDNYDPDSAFIKIDGGNRLVVRNGNKQNPGNVMVAVGVFNGRTANIIGEWGKPHSITRYPWVGSEVLDVRTQFADGGRAYNGGVGAFGGMFSRRNDNNSIIQIIAGQTAQFPGGGSAYNVDQGGNPSPSVAGSGRVIIYY